MKKRALLVGINYIGSSSELKGCINDVKNMHALLQSRGFTEFKIILEKEATTEGIKAGLEWLITGSVAGDVLVFHYSGHGSQYPSETEEDGFEEIICPIDLNWKDKVITDNTLKQIFSKVPPGVNTTLFLDCCHSGTMLDQTESLDNITRTIAPRKNKTRKQKGSRFMTPPTTVAKKLVDRSLVNWNTSRDVNQDALLIATCHASQTAADAFIDGIFQGAGTAAMLKIAEQNTNASYREIVLGMRNHLKENKFSQIPQLDGSSNLYDKKYLGPFVSVINEDYVNEVSLNTESDHVQLIESHESNSKKEYFLIIFVITIVILSILFPFYS